MKTCKHCGKRFEPIRGNWSGLCSARCRFWIRVDKNGPVQKHCPELGNCWVRSGSLRRGYNLFKSGKGQVQAHRFSWELAHGRIPAGMHVLHRCDCRNCIRFDHLFLGTEKDNAQDKARKGRVNAPRGERNGLSKVTEGDVRAIREWYRAKRGFTQTDLAVLFGLRQPEVSSIIRRECWRHVV